VAPGLRNGAAELAQDLLPPQRVVKPAGVGESRLPDQAEAGSGGSGPTGSVVASDQGEPGTAAAKIETEGQRCRGVSPG
jgi:hypothetical protein